MNANYLPPNRRYRLPLYLSVLYALGPTTFWLIVFGAILWILPDWTWRIKVAVRAEAGLILLGTLGIWRYSWYMINVVRSAIYSRMVFPSLRFNARAQQNPFPQRVYFLIPSYFEDENVSIRVFRALVREAASVPALVKAFISVGSDEEEAHIRNICAQAPGSERLQLRFLRQNQGKRLAMGDALRAIAHERQRDRMAVAHAFTDDSYNDVVVFMDGDTEMAQGTLARCVPYFKAYTRVGAITTDEMLGKIFKASWLVRSWFSLKFVKRHSVMKSHSLSRRVLTLTGRYSAFRADAVMTEEFVRHLEDDHIYNWVFGRIRFLMGDDKSTWFSLIKNKWDMLYLPDTMIYSLETRSKGFFSQALSLMYRWHGNTLRNSARSIALGPKGTGGFFIWMCILDQRISMWTTLVAPIAMILLIIFITPWFAAFYAAWLILIRLIQLWILVLQGHRMTISDMFLQLFDQWVGSFVKILALFSLGKQRWGKAKGQSVGDLAWYAAWVPTFLAVFYIMLLILGVGLLTDVFNLPDYLTLRQLFARL
ncbi:MAG: glycosyltransferase [Bacteroidota bacterium]